jgi:pimeloyl-ACP methyl ester carboxylesterase
MSIVMKLLDKRFKNRRLLTFLLVGNFFFTPLIICSQTLPSDVHEISIADLKLGDYVKASGLELMTAPMGLIRISDISILSDTIVYIALHGYASQGYEWIYPLKRLAQTGFPTYFYHYDWTLCPDILVKIIQKDVQRLLGWSPRVKKLVLIAHSYGGLLAVSLAGERPESVHTFEVHVVAAPLAGHPAIVERCSGHGAVLFDSTFVLSPGVTLYQWRTIKEQDGAYRKLDTDPQAVNIPGSIVTVLPPLLDGHRLGHNWSLTWVIDAYLGPK